MLSFSQLSYSYVFVKWKKCNILPSFLLIHIVDSTFHHQPKAGGPPFSPERETFRMLSFSQLSYAYVFVKWKKCNILPSFLLIHIVDSTFHQTDCCGSPQTIRWFRRSDGKPVGLPIRRKELRTFSCFPLAQHTKMSLRLMVGASQRLAGRYILNGCRSVP